MVASLVDGAPLPASGAAEAVAEAAKRRSETAMPRQRLRPPLPPPPPPVDDCEDDERSGAYHCPPQRCPKWLEVSWQKSQHARCGRASCLRCLAV